MMKKVHEIAPNVKLTSYYTSRDNLQHDLAANEVSFSVDPFPPSDSEIKKELIFEDEFVCVFRKDHKLAAASLWSFLKTHTNSSSNMSSFFISESDGGNGSTEKLTSFAARSCCRLSLLV